MNNEELENEPDLKTKRYIGMKSIMDFGMGIIYIGVGILILIAKRFHFENEFIDSVVGKAFACMVIFYGAWRLYRGIKKDYFVER